MDNPEVCQHKESSQRRHVIRVPVSAEGDRPKVFIGDIGAVTEKIHAIVTLSPISVVYNLYCM